MTELFVFTLLASLVAVYGILPKHRQLRVGYGLMSHLPILILSAFAVVIISTYVGGLLLQPQNKDSLGTVSARSISLELTQVSIDLIQLVAVLGIVTIFVSLFAKGSVRIRNEEVLLSKLRHLYNREEYGALVDVIRENHTPLINHPEKPQDPERRRIFEVMNEALDLDEDEAQERYMQTLRETGAIPTPENEDSESLEGEDDDSKGPESANENEDTEELENLVSRLHKWAKSIGQVLLDQVGSQISATKYRANGAAGKLRNKWESWRRRADYRVSQLRYAFAETAEQANEYTESLLLDPEFGAKYPILDPGLGIDVIKDDSIEGIDRRQIVHRFLKTLLKTENSLLYREVKKLGNHSASRRYSIESENRLMHALFSNCNRAEDLDVYKPIGDKAEEIILKQSNKQEDGYNGRGFTSSTSDNADRFNDPLFVAISYFDIMLKEALHQRMTWHFWLFYYESITKHICRNFKITSQSESDRTYPNDYSLLLFEMVDNMTRWLDAVEKMRVDDEHDIISGDGSDGKYMDFIKLESIDADRTRNNIPKATVICLISCHRHIVTTDEIPRQFKEYITEEVFTKAAELRTHDEGSLLWQYSELFVRCIEYEHERRASGDEYRQALNSAFTRDLQADLRHQGSGGQDFASEIGDILWTEPE